MNRKKLAAFNFACAGFCLGVGAIGALHSDWKLVAIFVPLVPLQTVFGWDNWTDSENYNESTALRRKSAPK